MEEAAEEGESRRVAEEQEEEAGSQPASDGCGVVVFRFLRGILAAPVFYIIEPYEWYKYVRANRERLTPFEDAFLVSSATCESLGQTVFLVFFVLSCFSSGDPSISPILLLVGWRLFGQLVSSLSAIRWVTFEAIWGFDDSDDDLRRSLTYSCFGGAASGVLLSGFDPYAFIAFWAIYMYPVMIYFERKILLSERERLCPGPLGGKFVAFRTCELFVVTPLLYIYCYFFAA